MTTKAKAKKPAATAAPEEKQERKQSLYAQAVMSERTKKADWSATADDCIADLRRVQKENEDRFISRNFYRVNGAYSDATWNRYFGTFEEFKSAAGLQLSRAQRHLEKHIARHAHLDNYRNFFEKEVAPWVGKYEKTFGDGRIKTILAASDFHDIEVDRFVLSVFLDTAKRIQPDVIVLNGDVFDLYEFSRFNIDPRKFDIKGRFDFVREQIFKPLRDACPNAQIDFTIGNHEQRLLKLLADKTPAMKVLMDLMGITMSKILGLDEFEINLIAKNDFAAYNAKEMHEEVRRNFKKYFDTVIFNHIGDENYGMSSVSGHVHKNALTSKVNEIMGPIWHAVLGCMCKVDAEYHEMKVTNQNGFGIIHVDTYTRSAVPELVVFGKEHAVVGGVYYFRNVDEE